MAAQVLVGAEVEDFQRPRVLERPSVVQQAVEYVDAARVGDLAAGQVGQNADAVLIPGAAIGQNAALLVDQVSAPASGVEHTGVGEGSAVLKGGKVAKYEVRGGVVIDRSRVGELGPGAVGDQAADVVDPTAGHVDQGVALVVQRPAGHDDGPPVLINPV